MRLLKLNGCFLLQRFGMTGLVPCSRRSSRSSALSYALSPSIRFDGFTNEALCDRAIVCFTCGQQDGDKAPFNICECVNLRIAPSARAANSLLFLPPFPPAAERWALTCVESIICVSVDRPFLASCLNRFSQMPRRAQRTKRL